jgi:hypothetical protein
MSWKKIYRDRYDYAFAAENDFNDAPPKKGETEVSSYVGKLWDDGKKFLENSFMESEDSGRLGFSSPESFWDACSKLENGQHYAPNGPYATRRSGVGNSWKQELIDNEIQKQIRAKKNHITANWHEIVISPNIVGINEIFDQERKRTQWSEHIREWVGYAQNFGGVWIRSILDKTEDPAGIATEMTCKNGSVLRTPETRSIKKAAGCWYVIHGEKVNDHWVQKNYPKIDLSKNEGHTPSFFEIDKKAHSYSNTKLFNKLEAFLDDDTYVEIPYEEEDFDQRIGLLMAPFNMANEDPQRAQDESATVMPKETDNHKKFIKAYSDWAEEKIDFYKRIEAAGELIPEDAVLAENAIKVVDEQLAMHEEMLAKTQDVDPAQKIPAGKMKKYPKGRYICTINGVTAEDDVNPYNNEWRNLFHYLANEKVPERIDGRGDVEILWQDNRILDTFVSRFADDALLATHKKPWFKRSEKAKHDAEGLSTNPTEPGYFDDQAPIFATGTANNQYLEMYNLVKGGIKETLGINQTTRGESNFAGESGKHAEALISQNVTMVAGELNMNLNDVLEDIVEARFEMWKEFYIEPRPYTIDGQQKMLVLSEHLKQMQVEENGQLVMKDIGKIEVSIKPESNFPNRDESEINTLVSLSKVLDATGQPIIPPDMILDYVSRRFPSLGSGGKYRKLNELVAIGKQVLQQQQSAQAQQQQVVAEQGGALDQVKQKVQSRMTTDAANQIMANRGMVPSNGNGMGVQA